MSETESKNFIEQLIDKDLEEGVYDHVHTRFPPEPNGYLHIGHAKSILLNYGLAQKYHGKFNMRFDDTNPTKEDVEFVESIKEDIRWLGADWEDRLFFASGGRFANKLGTGVVSCRRGGASAAFDELNKYFTVSNMPVVSGTYWNQVHGNTPNEVKQDLEGMQNMRALGRNMAWLLKCIEQGKAAGIALPKQEEKIMTNFVR